MQDTFNINRSLVDTSFVHLCSFFHYIVERPIKPAHVVTPIKQSPVLKGHLFLFPS